ncbi:MAG: hypothetical protein HPY54_14010 [Chthonomonadetes bacterium]|nr:hypothetical protein [Chthonomonadetes bacterium]
MGITRRIKRIAKAYLRSARQRLDDLEAELARRELEEALQPGGGLRDEPPRLDPVTSADQPASPSRAGEVSIQPDTPAVDLPACYRLLGLPEDATLEQLETTYHNLMKRADPSRFPEGSEERKRAESIQEKIQLAYRKIREQIDPTFARVSRIDLGEEGVR